MLTDLDRRWAYNSELQAALKAGDDDYTGEARQLLCCFCMCSRASSRPSRSTAELHHPLIDSMTAISDLR